MTPTDLLAALRGGWRVLLAGLLVTAGLCLLAGRLVPPTYQSQASLMLVPGKGSIAEGGNPLLYLGGLTQARDVLVRAMGAEDVVEPLMRAFPGSEVAISADPTTSGPMVLVTAVGPTEDASLDLLGELVAAAPATLERLQDGVQAPEPARASVMTLASDTAATVLRREQVRAVLAVGVAGLATTALGVGALGAARRREDGTPGPGEADGADDEPALAEPSDDGADLGAEPDDETGAWRTPLTDPDPDPEPTPDPDPDPDPEPDGADARPAVPDSVARAEAASGSARR